MHVSLPPECADLEGKCHHESLLITAAQLKLGLIFNYRGLVEENVHLNGLKLLKPIPWIYKKKGGIIKAKKKKNPTIRISANMLDHIGLVSKKDLLMWHQDECA